MDLILFISVSIGLISSQPQFFNQEVSTQTTTPFLLSNGALYRDMQTIEASISVAKFAKMHKHDSVKKPQGSEANPDTKPPKFIQFKNFTFGYHQNDNDIFDFTDSRFLNPPEENRQNRPIIKSINKVL